MIRVYKYVFPEAQWGEENTELTIKARFYVAEPALFGTDPYTGRFAVWYEVTDPVPDLMSGEYTIQLKVVATGEEYDRDEYHWVASVKVQDYVWHLLQKHSIW